MKYEIKNKLIRYLKKVSQVLEKNVSENIKENKEVDNSEYGLALFMPFQF